MSFTWKYGRLLSTTTLSDGTKITYRYNANGMRTQKQVGSKVTNYYYDSNNNLIAQRPTMQHMKNMKCICHIGLLVEESMIFLLKGILE